MTPTRRQFLLGSALLVAAPAIVRASSLMPVSPIKRTYACGITYSFFSPVTGAHLNVTAKGDDFNLCLAHVNERLVTHKLLLLGDFNDLKVLGINEVRIEQFNG